MDCHQPLRFTTGGGTKPASSTVGIWPHETQQMSNLYMSEECPLALPIGQLVNKSGFSFHWEPSRLPWLQSLDGECAEEHHVDHNVPIFRSQCELQYIWSSFTPLARGGSRDSNSSRERRHSTSCFRTWGRKLEKPKLSMSHGPKVPRHLLRAVRFIIVSMLRKLRPGEPHGPLVLRRLLRIAQLRRLGLIICLQITS